MESRHLIQRLRIVQPYYEMSLALHGNASTLETYWNHCRGGCSLIRWGALLWIIIFNYTEDGDTELTVGRSCSGKHVINFIGA